MAHVIKRIAIIRPIQIEVGGAIRAFTAGQEFDVVEAAPDASQIDTQKARRLIRGLFANDRSAS